MEKPVFDPDQLALIPETDRRWSWVEIDLSAIRAAGFDPTVFVVACERAEGSTLRERAAGPVAAKEPVSWLSE